MPDVPGEITLIFNQVVQLFYLFLIKFLPYNPCITYYFLLMVNCWLCFIMQNLYSCACSSTEGPLRARKKCSDIFATSPVLANRNNAGLRHFHTGFTFQTQKLHSSFMHNLWEDCMSARFSFGRIRKSILKLFSLKEYLQRVHFTIYSYSSVSMKAVILPVLPLFF